MVEVVAGIQTLPLQLTITRGVHQTEQTTKTAPKPLAKWHNRTAPQVIVHRIASYRMVQCGLRFYNKKNAQTALHHPLSIY